MNTIQRITKNTLVLFIAQIVNITLGLFYTSYMARYLGAEGFGILSFALAFTGMLSIFSDMGLSQVIVREVARNNELAGKYVGNIILVKIILGIFTLFLIIAGINLLNYSLLKVKIITLIGLSIIIGTFSKIYYSIFQAFEKMEFQSIGQIINSVALFIGTIIAVNYGCDIFAFAMLYFIVSIINLIYSLRISSMKFINSKLKYEYRLWKKLLIEAFPFAITGISINVYMWTDTLMLSVLKGDEVVGWYNAAYRLILVLFFIPIAFNNSIFPLMSKYFILSKKDLIFSFKKFYKIMMIVGFPLGFGTVFISNKIILLIYGSQFTDSIIILKILIWSLVLVFLRSPFERLFESINQQSKVSKAFMVGAFLNVIMNIILIPKYSYLGAGIATVLTDLVVFILLYMFAQKMIQFQLENEAMDIIKIITSCIIMSIFLRYTSNLNIFIQIFSSICIYLLCMEILQVLSEEDKTLIKSILPQNIEKY